MKELLIKLRDFIINQEPSIFRGMCGQISIMYYKDKITNLESIRLKDYIKSNKPNFVSSGVYWWDPGLKQPRIDWLNDQINKL